MIDGSRGRERARKGELPRCASPSIVATGTTLIFSTSLFLSLSYTHSCIRRTPRTSRLDQKSQVSIWYVRSSSCRRNEARIRASRSESRSKMDGHRDSVIKLQACVKSPPTSVSRICQTFAIGTMSARAVFLEAIGWHIERIVDTRADTPDFSVPPSGRESHTSHGSRFAFPLRQLYTATTFHPAVIAGPPISRERLRVLFR